MKKILICLAAFACIGCTTVRTADDEKKGDLATDKYYQLVGIKNGDEFIKIEPEHGSNALINFHSDGRIETTSGVNLGHGSYFYSPVGSADFSKLEIKQLGVTRMAAENEQANFFDMLYYKNLSNCAYAAFQDRIIKLYDKNKTELLEFYLK